MKPGKKTKKKLASRFSQALKVKEHCLIPSAGVAPSDITHPAQCRTGSQNWLQPQCAQGVSGLLVTTVPDALVEMSTAVEWECLYSGRGAKLKAVSLIFKEAASNFRKTQPKDVFTRQYIHSGHELGCSCQPGDEGGRKLLCRDAGFRDQEAACWVHGSLPPGHSQQAMP